MKEKEFLSTKHFKNTRINCGRGLGCREIQGNVTVRHQTRTSRRSKGNNETCSLMVIQRQVTGIHIRTHRFSGRIDRLSIILWRNRWTDRLYELTVFSGHTISFVLNTQTDTVLFFLDTLTLLESFHLDTQTDMSFLTNGFALERQDVLFWTQTYYSSRHSYFGTVTQTDYL